MIHSYVEPGAEPLEQWLQAYGASHRNPINKAIHRVFVPVIAVATLGLFHPVPMSAVADAMPPLSLLLAAAAVGYYLRLSLRLGVVMAVLATAAIAVIDLLYVALANAFVPLLIAMLAIAWIAQFVGHWFEGAKPSFAEDAQFLLIGPLWLLADTLSRLGMVPPSRPPYPSKGES